MSIFDAIRDLCKNYITDPLCVFGSFGKYIIVMKKIFPADPHVGLGFSSDTPVSMIYGTVTNEDRPNIIDPLHARYRASKLRVLLAIDINDFSSLQQVTQALFSHTNVFTVGEIIESPQRNLTFGDVGTFGIEYFKTIESAYTFNMGPPPNFTGCWVGRHSNGRKHRDVEYIDGKRSGLMTEWYYDGQKYSEACYIDGKQSGRWAEWYNSGQKKLEGQYDAGKETGMWIEWYDNQLDSQSDSQSDCVKKSEGQYENGKRSGEWTEWDKRGKVLTNGEYTNGKRSGYWITCYENGKELNI